MVKDEGEPYSIVQQHFPPLLDENEKIDISVYGSVKTLQIRRTSVGDKDLADTASIFDCDTDKNRVYKKNWPNDRNVAMCSKVKSACNTVEIPSNVVVSFRRDTIVAFTRSNISRVSQGKIWIGAWIQRFVRPHVEDCI